MSEENTRRSGVRDRIATELDSLRSESRFRQLDLPRGISFCSNDYLGLARDPRLKRALMNAVQSAITVGSTGSRLLSGNSAQWEELESDFAHFTGTEAAVFFGSGYAANVGLLSSMLKAGDFVYSDALNHASIIDGIRLSGATKIIFPHHDVEFLECALRENAGGPGARVIVTESIFSMEGDVAPLEQMMELARRFNAELVVDEAHAVGVRGPHGRGLAAGAGLEREILSAVFPCGKALASAGAFVCCSQSVKNYLVNRARTFIFSTALPPYFAGQIRAALELARQADAERAHLSKLSAVLRESLAARGFRIGASATQIVPIMIGSDEAALRIAEAIQARGFGVKSIRPPSVPEGTARIRVSLTCRHTYDDIARLAEALETSRDSLQPSSRSSVVHA